LQATTALNQSISQRGFAMVYVGNDGKISNVIHQKGKAGELNTDYTEKGRLFNGKRPLQALGLAENCEAGL
jgi:hypothetical protein